MSFNKFQTKKNLVSNIISFIVTGSIGLVLPPFLINRLSIEAYSLIPIVLSITSFMLIFTISINSTLSRFLLLANQNKKSEVFSSAFIAMLAIIAMLIPISFLFLNNIDRVINLPANYSDQAYYLFLFSIFGFFFNTIMSLYNSIPYAKNRIDYRNTSLIINRILILIIIFILFFIGYENIIIYGIAAFISSLIACIYSYLIYKKLEPDIEVKLSLLNLSYIKEMSHTSLWIIINQIGVLLLLQTDIIVINKILGPKESAIYGTIIQWSFLIRSLVGLVAGIMGPLILNLYKMNDISKLKEMSILSIKIIGTFVCIISFILAYFSKDIISIWIGDNFSNYSTLFMIIIIHLGVNLSISGITNINIAYDKTRIPGLMTVAIGLFNLVSDILVLKYTNWGLLGIGIVGLVSLSMKNFIFTPFYASKIMKINIFDLYKPILNLLLFSILFYSISQLFPSSLFNINNSLIKLIFYAGCLGLILTSIFYKVFFCKKEIAVILSVLLSKNNKINK